MVQHLKLLPVLLITGRYETVFECENRHLIVTNRDRERTVI